MTCFKSLEPFVLRNLLQWETLKEFLPDPASSEDRADEERMPCYNIDSESEAMSALFEEDD